MPLRKYWRDTLNQHLSGLIVCLALLGGSAGCESFADLTRVTNDHFPRAVKCGKCHIDIYAEWSGSDHARAYTNPHFRRSTNDHAFTDCLNCHAPEPTVSLLPPKTRHLHRDEGITCVSCHLENGVLSGPFAPTGKVKPHPVGVNPELYRGSQLCGRCHEGTYAQWQDAPLEDKKTCQQCHMPAVTRKVTQSAGGISKLIVSLEHEVVQRQHVFRIQTDESICEMVSVTATQAGSEVELSVRNNVPHLLPTGDFGFRVLDLIVSRTDRQGNTIEVLREELTKELKSAIPAGASLQRIVQLPADAQTLRLRIQRRSYQDQAMLELFDQEVTLK
jgi:hypothetical protein